jgi:serine O-acetyltransferase
MVVASASPEKSDHAASFETEKIGFSFKQVLKSLAWDLERYCHRLEVGRLQVILFSPGFHATMVYRLGHWLLPITRKKRGLNVVVALLMAVLRRFTEIVTGIYISPEAVIGEGLLMIHFGGIVIGPSIIGRNCEIFQQVTLGVAKSTEGGVPKLGDRVYLAPGAKVLGKIQLGDDVCVGPNSVLVTSVPDRSVVIGNPGRVVAKTGSFDLVLYPGMEFDTERQNSMAIVAASRLEQNSSEPQLIA